MTQEPSKHHVSKCLNLIKAWAKWTLTKWVTLQRSLQASSTIWNSFWLGIIPSCWVQNYRIQHSALFGQHLMWVDGVFLAVWQVTTFSIVGRSFLDCNPGHLMCLGLNEPSSCSVPRSCHHPKPRCQLQVTYSRKMNLETAFGFILAVNFASWCHTVLLPNENMTHKWMRLPNHNGRTCSHRYGFKMVSS